MRSPLPSPPPAKRVKIDSLSASERLNNEGKPTSIEANISEADGDAPEAVDTDDEVDQCTICLQPLRDRTVLPICSHEFCFECIVIWTEQSRRCPLCTRAVGPHLVHRIRSRTDFQRYFLPPLPPSPSSGQSLPRANTRVIPRTRTRADRERDRREVERARMRDEIDALDRAVDRRKWVYAHGLYAKHVASNSSTRYRPYPTPSQFAANQELIKRATIWIRRELRVWPSLDIEFLVTFVISLMKSLDIRSEGAVKLLAEFLDIDTGLRANAEHFAHELYSFMRSPFKDVTVYDSVVQYEIPPHVSPPQERPRPLPHWHQPSPHLPARHEHSDWQHCYGRGDSNGRVDNGDDEDAYAPEPSSTRRAQADSESPYQSPRALSASPNSQPEPSPVFVDRKMFHVRRQERRPHMRNHSRSTSRSRDCGWNHQHHGRGAERDCEEDQSTRNGKGKECDLGRNRRHAASPDRRDGRDGRDVQRGGEFRSRSGTRSGSYDREYNDEERTNSVRDKDKGRALDEDGWGSRSRRPFDNLDEDEYGPAPPPPHNPTVDDHNTTEDIAEKIGEQGVVPPSPPLTGIKIRGQASLLSHSTTSATATSSPTSASADTASRRPARAPRARTLRESVTAHLRGHLARPEHLPHPSRAQSPPATPVTPPTTSESATPTKSITPETPAEPSIDGPPDQVAGRSAPEIMARTRKRLARLRGEVVAGVAPSESMTPVDESVPSVLLGDRDAVDGQDSKVEVDDGAARRQSLLEKLHGEKAVATREASVRQELLARLSDERKQATDSHDASHRPVDDWQRLATRPTEGHSTAQDSIATLSTRAESRVEGVDGASTEKAERRLKAQAQLRVRLARAKREASVSRSIQDVAVPGEPACVEVTREEALRARLRVREGAVR